MKKYLTILFLCLLPYLIKGQTPTANAGADQTIYLSSGTNSVTLAGSATNRSTSTWTEVSTDYNSGGTITSPSSLSTTITGLNKQGVFYFKLDVNNGSGVHAYDTTAVHVNYDSLTGATKIHFFNMNDTNNINVINNRTDTTTYYPVTNQLHSQSGAHPNRVLIFRDRSLGTEIDQQHDKVINMIEDGYGGESNDGGVTHYARSEFSITQYDFTLDTTDTYVIEWQSYFPQSNYYINVPSTNPYWYSAVVMFQIHGNDAYSPPYALYLSERGNIYLMSYNHETGARDSITIGYYPDWYNKAHTIRVTMREGQQYPNQKAFFKLDVDGVQKYYNNTSRIGAIGFQDYLKFSGIYDYGRCIVNPDSLARGRKFKLVTNYMNVYTMSYPKVSMSGNQTVTSTSTTISAVATWEPSHSGTYKWTQTAGSGTISASTSATTSVSSLSYGTNTFKCVVTQDNGLKDSGYVSVYVKTPATLSYTSDTVQTYNGSPRSVTVLTSPSGISGVSTTYNNLSTPPTNAGTYALVSSLTNSTYYASNITGTFTINKATTTIVAANDTVYYDGLQHSITATNSAGVAMTYLYDGSSTPPSAIGDHVVDISISNTNWQATPVTVHLVIQSNPATIFISDTTKVYNGSSQAVTVTCPYSYSLTYNGSSTAPTNTGTYQVIATINDGIHTGADTANLTISKATPVLTYATPSRITDQSPLSSAQLNATSNVAGSFTYNYPNGTVFSPGTYTLTATFTPSDTSNYNGETVSTTLTVVANPYSDFFISNGKIFWYPYQ